MDTLYKPGTEERTQVQRPRRGLERIANDKSICDRVADRCDLYGFAFEKADLTHWAQNVSRALLTNPSVYIPEIVGAGILLWFALKLLRRREVYAFIRSGQV